MSLSDHDSKEIYKFQTQGKDWIAFAMGKQHQLKVASHRKAFISNYTRSMFMLSVKEMIYHLQQILAIMQSDDATE